jgi:hypothetical protein
MSGAERAAVQDQFYGDRKGTIDNPFGHGKRRRAASTTHGLLHVSHRP